MKRSFSIFFFLLTSLLASSVSLADMRLVVIRGADCSEPKLSKIGITTQSDGSALLVLSSPNDGLIGECTVRTKGLAEAIALRDEILAHKSSNGRAVFCMMGKTVGETVLHIEDAV